MTGTRTALVVANSGDDDAGYVGERLEQRGFVLHTVLRDHGEVVADIAAAGEVDVLLLLGSDWSVHSPADAEALAAECALVRSAPPAGVPVFAICYGAQVVAAAFGGSVVLAEYAEVGPIHVESADAALVPAGPWQAFHVDAVRLPPGAVLVAANDCGPQAFLLPGVLAVQFHPEVRPLTLDDWARRFPELVTAAGQDRATLLARAEDAEEAARAAAYALVDAFLDRHAPLLASRASSTRP